MIADRRIIGVSVALLFGLSAMMAVPVRATEGESELPALADEQVQAIRGVDVWKISVEQVFNDAEKYKGVPVQDDCRHLFEVAGLRVVASDSEAFDGLFRIQLTGSPRSSRYMGAPAVRYSGANVHISASVDIDDKRVVDFSPSSASSPCPFMISGGYTTPESAPFERTYYNCRRFFLQVFALIHATRGPEGIMNVIGETDWNDTRIRTLACRFAGVSGDQAFGALLLGALDSGDSTVRADVCTSLGMLRDVGAVETLSGIALADTSWSVRTAAASALGKIGQRSAVEALCQLVVTDGAVDVRVAAAEALAELGDPAANPFLEKVLLFDNDHGAQKKAAESLEQLGWKPVSFEHKVFYCLAKEQEDQIRALGADAVPVLMGGLDHISSATKTASVRLLGELGDVRAVEPLCEVLATAESKSLRQAAASAAGKIGDSKAISPLCQALLTDKEWPVRKAAAEALGTIAPGTEAVESLCQALLTDDQSSVRDAAAEALGKIGDVAAVEPLCQVLVTDKGRQVRIETVRALGKIGDSKASSSLAKALVFDGDNVVRTSAAEALDGLGWKPDTEKEKVFYWLAKTKHDQILQMKQAAVPVLLEALDHEDADIQSAGVRLLGQLGEGRAAEPLCEIMMTTKNYSLRKEAAEALGQIGNSDSVEPLCQILVTDDRTEVRRAAAGALGDIGDTAAVEILSQALGKDKDGSVRGAAAQALGKIGDAAAVAGLSQSLGQDEDSSVRMAAVESLRKIGGNEAVDGLKAGLEKEKDEKVRTKILEAISELDARSGEGLGFADRLQVLANNNKWKEIRTLLAEQPVEKVIEALKIDEALVKNSAVYQLKLRTKQYNIENTYEAWKKWWDEEGSKTP